MNTDCTIAWASCTLRKSATPSHPSRRAHLALLARTRGLDCSSWANIGAGQEEREQGSRSGARQCLCAVWCERQQIDCRDRSSASRGLGPSLSGTIRRSPILVSVPNALVCMIALILYNCTLSTYGTPSRLYTRTRHSL